MAVESDSTPVGMSSPSFSGHCRPPLPRALVLTKRFPLPVYSRAMRPRGIHFKCRHCHRVFVPDYRNRYHQRYCCRQEECRQASKRATQRRWCSKPENRAYFCGADRVEHVQAWRKTHPGYWRRRARARGRTLQEHCSTPIPSEPSVSQEVKAEGADHCGDALQDLCRVQVPLLVGLVEQVGAALQKDILGCARLLIERGQQILGQRPGLSTIQRYETG